MSNSRKKALRDKNLAASSLMALRGLAAAMKEEKGRYKAIFDVAKVGCEHRVMYGFAGQPTVYVCDSPSAGFAALCCMESCPLLK